MFCERSHLYLRFDVSWEWYIVWLFLSLWFRLVWSAPTSFLVAGRGHIPSLPVAGVHCILCLGPICVSVCPSGRHLGYFLGWCTECCHDHWGLRCLCLDVRPGRSWITKDFGAQLSKDPCGPVVQVLIYLPTNSVEGFPNPHPLLLLQIFVLAILTGVRYSPHWTFDLHFSNNPVMLTIFPHLYGHLYAFLAEMSL